MKKLRKRFSKPINRVTAFASCPCNLTNCWCATDQQNYSDWQYFYNMDKNSTYKLYN